jgi:hypothetical protein
MCISESGPVELFYYQKWAKNSHKNGSEKWPFFVSVRLNINPKLDSSLQRTMQGSSNKLDKSCLIRGWGSESGPVKKFYCRKWAKNSQEKSCETWPLFRECETEYESETRLLASKHDAMAFKWDKQIVFDMWGSESGPENLLYFMVKKDKKVRQFEKLLSMATFDSFSAIKHLEGSPKCHTRWI